VGGSTLAANSIRGLAAEPWVTIELRGGQAFVDGARVEHPGSPEERYRAAVGKIAAEVAGPLGRLVGVTVTRKDGVVDHLAVHPDGNAALIRELVRSSTAMPVIVPTPRSPGDDADAQPDQTTREPGSPAVPVAPPVSREVDAPSPQATSTPPASSNKRRNRAQPRQVSGRPANSPVAAKSPVRSKAVSVATQSRPGESPQRGQAPLREGGAGLETAAPQVAPQKSLAKSGPRERTRTTDAPMVSKRPTSFDSSAKVVDPSPAAAVEMLPKGRASPSVPTVTSPRRWRRILGALGLVVGIVVAVAGAGYFSRGEVVTDVQDPELVASFVPESGTSTVVPPVESKLNFAADPYVDDDVITINVMSLAQPATVTVTVRDSVTGAIVFTGRRTYVGSLLVFETGPLARGEYRVRVTGGTRAAFESVKTIN
jgi:hypothetical protein